MFTLPARRPRRRLGALVVALALASGLLPAEPADASPAHPSPAGHDQTGWRSLARSDRRLFPDLRGASDATTSRPAGAQRNGIGHRADGPTSPVPSASAVAFDASTQTLYVTGELTDTVAVIDARSCNAQRTRCQDPVATMPGFATDGGVRLDADHHTLYVATHNGTVVGALDLRHCTARDTSGCSARPNSVPVGTGSVGMALNRRTHTLYVGSETSPLAVIDTATCNGHARTGCAAPIATLGSPGLRLFPTVDPATDTLYVPYAPDVGDPGIEVWDVSACRAGRTTGCGAERAGFVPLGLFTLFVQLEDASGTLFAGNVDDYSLSLIDARTCNARTTSGCRANHPKVAIQLGPEEGMADPTTRTLYVMGSLLDQVVAIDLRTCTVHTPDLCPTRPRSMQISPHPYGFDLDPATGTMYVVSPVQNTLEVFDARACSARRSEGCRREAPSVRGLVTQVDPAHHTAFQLFDDQPAFGLLDTSRCNSVARVGCDASVRVRLGQQPGSLVMDLGTHTVYAMDRRAHQLLVVDTNRCSATRPGGCVPLATIAMPDGGFPALNPRTHAVYVSLFNASIAVVDGTRCNATDRSGCDDDPLLVPVGGAPVAIWVDPASNTVYVTDVADDEHNLLLLDGTACEARTAGCRKIADTTVGSHPAGLSGNPADHTLYAADYAFTDQLGSLSLVDTRHCRVGDTRGCDRSWPRAAAGHSTFGVHYDPATDTVFTADVSGTVSIIPAARCTALRQDGCPAHPARIAVGNFGRVSYLDPTVHTLYVHTDEGTSIIDSRHPCRSGLCFR